MQIDPCKAVSKRVAKSDCDINTINNLCYGVCYSYGNVYGEDVKRACEQKCRAMISRKKQELGTNDCYKRQPSPPPQWFQVPDYFPELLSRTGDAKVAKAMCIQQCKGGRLEGECIAKCTLNADAVIAGPTKGPDQGSTKGSRKESYSTTQPPATPGCQKSSSCTMWITIAIFLAVAMIAHLLFIRQ